METELNKYLKTPITNIVVAFCWDERLFRRAMMELIVSTYRLREKPFGRVIRTKGFLNWEYESPIPVSEEPNRYVRAPDGRWVLPIAAARGLRFTR